MTDMKPFADDSRQISLRDLVIENGTDQVSLHGSFDFARDKQSLEAAKTLATLFQAMADEIAKTPDLPEQVAPIEKSTKKFENPFGE